MTYDTLISMRRKRSVHTFRLFFFILIIGIGVGIFYFIYKPSTAVVSPIPQEGMFSFLPAGRQVFFPIFSQKKDPEKLKKLISDTVGTTLTQYSVVVHDFHNDFTMSINPDMVFTGVSVNKIPILAVLYYLVQNGDISLDKKITLQEEDIQNYGTGSIRYDEPGTIYTIRNLACLMMQQSDNTAAYILGRHVEGMNTIQKTIDSWGMAQTDMEQNLTSNADISLLMEKMYREKIANKVLTADMFSCIKDGTIEDRIPALLPKDITVYHKTGNGVASIHDVGIIVTPKFTYYIGLFTSDVPDEQKATQLLATISRIVYDFMK